MPATALLALATLTACGGNTGSEPDVASVDGTSGKGQAAKTSDPDAGRPQLRLDTSQEEKRRLFNVWSSCMHDHGVRMQSVIKDGRRVPDNTDPAYAAGSKACLPKLPLDPPELDRKKNPHYMDDFRAQITCLHKAGVMVEPRGTDGDGYSYPDGEINVPDLPALERRCLIEAFSEHSPS